MDLDGGRKTGVTVSVGIAASPDHGISAEELVAAADAALYRSKHEGRNRVFCAEGQSGYGI
jgi:diguanylate cyclase (GGDEF)-like protein